MQIKNASYLLTAVKASQYPTEQLPAVTFCGRSNVGKSSLINTLLNRKNLARTSAQPGKTRTINFYDIDKSWYLVDLPGYGYAKVAKSERENWRYMIDEFLRSYRGENLFLQLVDIRHEPSELDKQMWRWLTESGVRCRLVATKADKISRGARDKHLTVISKALQAPKRDIIAFSSLNREGKDALLAVIEEYLLSLSVDEEGSGEQNENL
jgi:GTP-binding protein